MNHDFWDRNDVQFPRLITEIKAVGLTDDQVKDLAKSMDLESDHIDQLLDRGEEVFARIEEGLKRAKTHCACCGSKIKGN